MESAAQNNYAAAAASEVLRRWRAGAFIRRENDEVIRSRNEGDTNCGTGTSASVRGAEVCARYAAAAVAHRRQITRLTYRRPADQECEQHDDKCHHLTRSGDSPYFVLWTS
jgi:hypothetical protein